MKKLKSYKEFEVGKIYNRIYIRGEYKEYSKINGKETFVVVAISPMLKTQTLFDQFGSMFSDELKGTLSTFSNPEKTFAKYDLFKVDNKSEWFIKSLWTTLQEALYKKLITLNDIKQSVGSWICLSGKDWCCRYAVEGKSKENPYLQRIFVK